MKSLKESLIRWRRRPWIWSFLGAILIWVLAVGLAGGHGGWSVFTTALAFSAFTVLVGLGQMFVITLGPGNIDLSLPANIGLASAVAMKVMDGSDARIAIGLGAAILAGLLIGLANYALIRVLRIPPLIATLSSSFVIRSVGISYGRGLQIKPPQAFADVVLTRIGGISLPALLVLLMSIFAGVVLARTVYGRSVLAVGQNARAARLAGLPVGLVRLATYALCGALGGLCGALLAGFTGGSSLDVGAEYLLTSIAVVVIGGTSVAGGLANVPGLWGAALMLFLTATLLNSSGLGVDVRDLMTGLIIIAVITLAGGRRSLR
ncbi:ABC transporter permease [Acidisoma cellulosilytica]|uniref:ABC transporter permease n=1 Tax=Acidisoma cellulosilyticum TaxID=2802395 RepID=A0A964E5N3_9PROT|nr:ABC transporter permease [Acidisoma cellulosilyticum]MCB8882617.1 ABC transporter permease [Acidisoma cellulosilyticum]